MEKRILLLAFACSVLVVEAKIYSEVSVGIEERVRLPDADCGRFIRRLEVRNSSLKGRNFPHAKKNVHFVTSPKYIERVFWPFTRLRLTWSSLSAVFTLLYVCKWPLIKPMRFVRSWKRLQLSFFLFHAHLHPKTPQKLSRTRRRKKSHFTRVIAVGRSFHMCQQPIWMNEADDDEKVKKQPEIIAHLLLASVGRVSESLARKRKSSFFLCLTDYWRR